MRKTSYTVFICMISSILLLSCGKKYTQYEANKIILKSLNDAGMKCRKENDLKKIMQFYEFYFCDYYDSGTESDSRYTYEFISDHWCEALLVVNIKPEYNTERVIKCHFKGVAMTEAERDSISQMRLDLENYNKTKAKRNDWKVYDPKLEYCIEHSENARNVVNGIRLLSSVLDTCNNLESFNNFILLEQGNEYVSEKILKSNPNFLDIVSRGTESSAKLTSQEKQIIKDTQDELKSKLSKLRFHYKDKILGIWKVMPVLDAFHDPTGAYYITTRYPVKCSGYGLSVNIEIYPGDFCFFDFMRDGIFGKSLPAWDDRFTVLVKDKNGNKYSFRGWMTESDDMVIKDRFFYREQYDDFEKLLSTGGKISFDVSGDDYNNFRIKFEFENIDYFDNVMKLWEKYSEK